ncbi:MAG: TonB-dependent receptor plug domain-containing protein, partial [bacterium]
NVNRQQASATELGYDVSKGRAKYSYQADYDRGELASLLGIERERHADISLDPEGWEGGAYASANLNLTARLAIQPSLRFDWQNYYRSSSRHQISPRFGISFEQNSHAKYWLSLGRYYQPQAVHELRILDGETDFSKPQYSDQLVAGVQLKREENVFRAEVYYKKYRDQKVRFENLFNPFVLLPELEPDRVALQPEKGIAKGVDVEWRHDFSDSLKGIVRYSYMDASDRINGRWAPRRWSQRQTLNSLVQWQTDGFHLSAAITWHSGWHTTFLPRETPEESQVSVGDILNNRELRNFLSFDVSASKSWVIGSTQLTLFADISNLFKRDNVSGVDFEAESEDGVTRFYPEREFLIPKISSIGFILAF